MARSDRSAEKVRTTGAEPVACDLENIRAEHLEGVDAVIHAAAYVEPWGSRADFWKGNVEGTERMLAAAQNAGVKRFVHIGTESAVFAGQDLNNIDESYPYPEKTPFLYSETKKEAEIRVLQANKPVDFETISLRPRFVWGPNDTTLLANLIEMVDSGKFRWINKGEAETSACYVENIAYAAQLALGRGKGGSAYFITDDENFTFRTIITKLLATTGRVPGEKNVPPGLAKRLAAVVEFFWRGLRLKKKPPVTRFAVAIMTNNCTLNIDRAKDELGYSPLVSVREGLKRMDGTAQ